MEKEWFKSFFDEIYYETYRPIEPEERNERETKFIVEALNLPTESRIIDIGCGYGRHAAYLAKWGYKIVCYDLSRYLLKKAQERFQQFKVENRVEIIEGDMRKLKYHEEFDGAYMFYTVFGYFSDEENINVMKLVAKALKPSGRLLIDLLNPIPLFRDAFEYGGSWKSWFSRGEYIILEETKLDPLESRIVSTRTYIRDGKVIGTRSFSLRLYTYPEIRNIMEKSGLYPTNTYGNTRGDPYTPTSPRLIIVAEKRG